MPKRRDNEPIVRFQFRLPEQLHDKLRSTASSSGRSLNSELIHRLEQSFSYVMDIGVGSQADVFFMPETKEELEDIVRAIVREELSRIDLAKKAAP